MEKINLFFSEVGLYRIPPGLINPIEPWQLELLLESLIASENKKVYINYTLIINI